VNWKRRVLDGLDDDIRDHIERETRDNVERGMPPEEARLAAVRKFGNVARVMEETRGVWQWAWVEQLFQDVRYGSRILRRNPRFAMVVMLTLALGIGINTAVFSVVNTVLLKPVACPNPERLVWISDHDPNVHRDFIWGPGYFKLLTQARSYTGMAGYGYQPTAIEATQGASQVTGVYAIGDFWSITGTRVAIGRLCGPDEPDCIVLSWDLFERQFGGDAGAVGKPVVMNGRPATIAGVLPRSWRFQLPMWWIAGPQPVDAFVSLPPPGQGIAQSMQVVAALKPGVGIEQAQAELDSLQEHIRHQDGWRRTMTKVRVKSLQDKLAGGAQRGLMVLLVAGAFVLLIACVNVANLLLARAAVRQKEVAIRAAVGAGRTRVIRQMLAESVLQALVGGTAGLLLARWAIAILVRISPYAIPRLAETAIDGRVLAFTFALSLLTGILFGAGPSISLWRANLHDALKDGGRNSAGVAGLRIRRMLVGVELSLAIVLLTGAGLMLKSFARMNERPAGFDPESVIVMKIRFAGAQYREDPPKQAYLGEVLRRIESAPGVRSAGLSNWVQFGAAPHVIRLNGASRVI
jgi:predicted permease